MTSFTDSRRLVNIASEASSIKFHLAILGASDRAHQRKQFGDQMWKSASASAAPIARI